MVDKEEIYQGANIIKFSSDYDPYFWCDYCNESFEYEVNCKCHEETVYLCQVCLEKKSELCYYYKEIEWKTGEFGKKDRRPCQMCNNGPEYYTYKNEKICKKCEKM